MAKKIELRRREQKPNTDKKIVKLTGNLHQQLKVRAAKESKTMEVLLEELVTTTGKL